MREFFWRKNQGIMQKRMIYRELRAEKRSGGDGKEECPYSFIYYMRAQGRTYAVKHTAVKGKRQGGKKRAGRTHKAGEGNASARSQSLPHRGTENSFTMVYIYWNFSFNVLKLKFKPGTRLLLAVKAKGSGRDNRGLSRESWQKISVNHPASYLPENVKCLIFWHWVSNFLTLQKTGIFIRYWLSRPILFGTIFAINIVKTRSTYCL